MQNFFLRLGPSGGHRVRAQRVPRSRAFCKEPLVFALSLATLR